jgi:DNA-binding protein YbaB
MSSPVPEGDETTAALNRWVADAEAMAAKYQQLSAEVDRVSVAETTPDGLITVTVNSAGIVTDLRITERATGLPGPKIAAGVLWAMRRAQSRIAAQVAELMKTTVGDDTAMVNAVMDRYNSAFPAPPEPAAARPPVVDEVQLGEPAQTPAAPRPTQQPAPQPVAAATPSRGPVRRPARSDDWDGGNDSFLEEVDR